jgi:hypothetical protein
MTEVTIPKTKDEAFLQLDEMLSDKEKREIAKRDPIEYHFSLGVWIRNNWIYQQEEEDVSIWQRFLKRKCRFLKQMTCQ